jgi:acyl-CoA reductase-like NAD-dependent aldehyde dehydrogenase
MTDIAELFPSPNPLVVYVFSEDEKFKKIVYEQTRTGSFVVNDTLLLPGGSFVS